MSHFRYVYTNNPTVHSPLYISLVEQWLYLLEEKDQITTSLDKYSWFFFRLITKSLAIDLHKNKLLTSERKARISDSYSKKLVSLIERLTEETKQQARANLSLARVLNAHIARFLSSLLDLLDRGFTFSLIDMYMHGVAPNYDTMELVELKFAFFKIIAAHDQYVPLNLPSEVVTIPSVTEIIPLC